MFVFVVRLCGAVRLNLDFVQCTFIDWAYKHVRVSLFLAIYEHPIVLFVFDHISFLNVPVSFSV